MLDLSVIILARNEELHIRRCLENILPVAKEAVSYTHLTLPTNSRV